MQSKQKAYLSEMEIEHWQLCRPERMQGMVIERDDLDPTIKLLLVSHLPFTSDEVIFLEKVLASFGVGLKEVMTVQPHQLCRLGSHQLEWIWFIDCPVQLMDSLKSLASAKLDQVSANPSLKKELWNQIVAYKEP
ncbi:DNA polymerase III subunit psi [Vibrio sp. RC27]